MNRLVKLIVAVSAYSIIAASPVDAKNDRIKYAAVEEKKVASGSATIKEDKAYIFVHFNARSNGVFLKEPSDVDLEKYEADWQEKFEKAKKKYPSKLARWEKLSKTVRGSRQEKPVKPTEENFSIAPIETRLLVAYGPKFVYHKDKSDTENPVFSYLVEVDPGTYFFYGPTFYTRGAQAIGSCFCMGSVKFEAKAGEITNLGNFLTNGAQDDPAASAVSHLKKLEEKSPDSKFIRWMNNPLSYDIPKSLEAYSVVQPDFYPSGKFNNILRVMVSRMGPVEGLFRYERDQVIDLKSKPIVTVPSPDEPSMPENAVEAAPAEVFEDKTDAAEAGAEEAAAPKTSDIS